MDKELRRLSRKNRLWRGLALVLLGTLLGYLLAPLKNGVKVENIFGEGREPEPEEPEEPEEA